MDMVLTIGWELVFGIWDQYLWDGIGIQGFRMRIGIRRGLGLDEDWE